MLSRSNRIKVNAAQVEASSFEALLEKSLEIWQAEERTGVWIFIPIAKASLIPVATSLGFDFHHAKPGTVALIKWLPDSACMIPKHPFTNVGVGAVIFKDSSMDHLLTVQEKHGPLKGKGVWKVSETAKQNQASEYIYIYFYTHVLIGD